VECFFNEADSSVQFNTDLLKHRTQNLYTNDWHDVDLIDKELIRVIVVKLASGN
jgi:hypothetical protein